MKRQNNRIHGLLGLGVGCVLAMTTLETEMNAATLVEQDFNLANGSLVEGSGGAWQHRSGGEGDLVVSEGVLQVSSSASEDAGISFGDAVYDESSTETLFASFTLKVVDLPTSGGGYFAHFRGGASSSFRGRLFIAASEDGGYQLGVSNGASKFADSIAVETVLEAGKEYRIVMSYEPSTAVTKLGVDPVLESDLSAVATDSVSVKSINQFAIRQASGIGTIQIDQLKISTEFSDLSASVEPQEPTLKIQSNQKVLPERGGPSFLIQIEREGPLDVALDLNLNWEGTAEFGVDYTDAPEVITFLPDQTTMEIQFTLVDDDLKEGTEVIEMTLLVPEGVNVSGVNFLSWEIQDYDLTTIEVSASTATVTEGLDEVFEIFLDRTGDISVPLEIKWTFDGSAEKGVDVDWSLPFSVSFSSGEERLILAFEVLNDSFPEPVEGFHFQLEASDEYQTENSETSIQILSDDYEGMLLSDNFDYESGPVVEVSSGKWEHTSGAERELSIFAGQLDLNEIHSEDIVVHFPIASSVEELNGSAYEVFVGMDLFVAKAPQGDGTYWAHFRGSTSSTFKGRLYSRSVNIEEGTFELGVSNGQSVADVWFPDVFKAPVKLRVVLGYKPDQSITRLWVNPEGDQALHVLAEDETSAPNVTGFAFRQPASRSGGMGRFLIDHLTISTEWMDVLAGTQKPYVFWQFNESANDVPEFTDGIDLLTTIWATGSESLIPSEDLSVHRLGPIENELWVNFTVHGDIVLDEDLSILQGQGPVLIKSAETAGVLNLAPIRDEIGEPNETMTLSLVPHDSYQIGYPNEALFVLQDATVIESPPVTPLGISISWTGGEGESSFDLKLEGAPGQLYTIQFSQDLAEWQSWLMGTLQSDVETLPLDELLVDHDNIFFQAISGQP